MMSKQATIPVADFGVSSTLLGQGNERLECIQGTFPGRISRSSYAESSAYENRGNECEKYEPLTIAIMTAPIAIVVFHVSIGLFETVA